MSSSGVDDWAEWKGKIVPKSFNAGYVVLSYVVSYIGAWTTLELIHRRTAMRGYYNWFLLAGSSISMGGIAIWCMHFIGNRAIILGNGTQFIQIAYSAGYTALSFFLPILVLFLAFWAVGSNERVSLARVGLGGALAGLGIVGMHYLGQAGISNYDCIYDIAKVIGAGVIAVVASVGALTVFFIWRSSWETSWWKRAICAVGLAGAVSGMHWLASVGTAYRLKTVDNSTANNISRNATVIVVIVLSVGACLLLITLTFLAQRRRALSANRAQQVVLAAAIFDKDGRLMVSPEGLLPNRKITNSFIERSFDDVFGIAHPVYLWIFRTTRNWSSVANLLPGMRHHIYRTGLKSSRNRTTSEIDLATDQGLPIEDYSLVFRELFCVAAADLAEDLHLPLEDVGVLFDAIISTGQRAAPKPKSGMKRDTPDSSVDLERNGLALPVFGRGQLLFLVSQASRREAEHLQAAGYRFANAQNVLPILARSMQVSSEEIAGHLESMKEFVKETKILEPGVHLACFAIRASVRGGFDVLVRKDARNQLPTMQLPFDRLEKWQADYLKNLDSHSVSSVINTLTKSSKSPSFSVREQTFATQFLTALESLKQAIDDPFFGEALLIAKPIEAPCRGSTENSQPGTATLLAFRLIAPIHSQAPGTRLEFIPLGFFRAQQHVYKNSPDHAVFARKTYREFAPVVEFLGRSSNSIDAKSPISDTFSTKGRIFNSSRRISSYHSRFSQRDAAAHIQEPLPTHSRRPSAAHPAKPPSKLKFWDKNQSQFNPTEKHIKDDTSSEKGLVDPSSSGGHTQNFGGIMVSQEISVDVRNSDRDDKGMELVELRSPTSSSGHSDGGAGGSSDRGSEAYGRVVTKVLKENSEAESFVDKLFGICVEGR
ncbi:hypothetical protein BP6252_12145 [Coleophoma cylindrospora]|uniref:MHYT domain-containing protein n=1 Tax=Coleophoma cylindrospora TaxID=1849047 RepID=A0A3D8QG08_9HELO|nr:hypothetical protein BP6252_12145 [Coleophoma cylindrospora]